MKSWVNRKRIGDHKHTTKQERKNFNRRSYSTSITPSYPVLNTNTENLDLQTNKWLHLKVKENYFQFVNENAIEYVLNQFWARIMNNLEDDQFVLVLFRVIYDDFIMTLGEMQKVNKNDLYKIAELYKKLFELKDEHYKTSEVKSFVISYNIIPDYKLKSNKSYIRHYREDNKGVTWNNIFGTNLPNTADFNLWGKEYLTKINNNGLSTHHIRKNDSSLIFIITELSPTENDVKICIKNKVILNFKDIIKAKTNKNTFTRIIISKNKNNQTFTYNEGKIIFKIVNKNTNFLTNINPSKNIDTNIIVMDIETRDINNIKLPYCICMYDGYNKYSFYLDNYNSIDLMLEDALSFLFKAKYNKHKIYFHNLSYFDSVFIIRILAKISKENNYFFKPQIKDGRIINLRLNFGKNYNIYFRDSYLLMPESLAKLAIAMNVEHKSLFPLFFPGTVDLNYVGDVPSIKFFKKDLELSDYSKYYESIDNIKEWSLKDETIKYCIQDCVSLHQVLSTFNSLIFDKFNLNINNYPTLSSLSFGIYRAHYLKDFKIPLIGGQILKDIREGYFGGHTDVYKTTGENLYVYDVNSLYPYVMSNYSMPIGNIKYFEGDIYKIEDKPFGFFLAEITAPDDLNVPILMTKAKINNTLKTLAPLGKWTGVIFSEELINAKDYGYEFKVLKGYTFDSDYIFKDFVNDLYEIKCNHPKDHPMYLISKLLLNSLYGRFGMHIETFLTHNAVVNNDELYEMMEHNNIMDVLNLDEDINLITYIPKTKDDNENSLFNDMTKFNISISLSAAITAYARIHMSQFKSKYNSYDLYYSDTDSIAIDKPLDDNMIGKELGKMKLEHIFDKAIYLGPKVYGGITKNGEEIIKAKGYKNKDQFKKDQLDFKTLESLLYLDNDKINQIELNHEKWFRNFELGEIKVEDQKYTLRATNNKRDFIIKDNKIIDTKPYIIHNNIVIESKDIITKDKIIIE
jgi:DNA polymerase type B, organellar and viral